MLCPTFTSLLPDCGSCRTNRSCWQAHRTLPPARNDNLSPDCLDSANGLPPSPSVCVPIDAATVGDLPMALRAHFVCLLAGLSALLLGVTAYQTTHARKGQDNTHLPRWVAHNICDEELRRYDDLSRFDGVMAARSEERRLLVERLATGQLDLFATAVEFKHINALPQPATFRCPGRCFPVPATTSRLLLARSLPAWKTTSRSCRRANARPWWRGRKPDLRTITSLVTARSSCPATENNPPVGDATPGPLPTAGFGPRFPFVRGEIGVRLAWGHFRRARG